MMVHVYRVGERDDEGLHAYYPRVTVFAQDDTSTRYEPPCLVLGTLPDVTVIPMAKIRWFWVEAD